MHEAFAVVFCSYSDIHIMHNVKLRRLGSCDFVSAQSGAGLLHGFVERPKQRRHRCKDPTKLDINSLTGEERVPVVHRGTGRRVGNTQTQLEKF